MRIAAAAALLIAAAPAPDGNVTWSPYGVTKDGRQVSQLVLTNENGMEVRLINYGAIVTDVIVPDAAGKRENVALGFSSLTDYEAKNGNYAFGAIMGRYAGRIANARFAIDGREVRLTPNDGPNALHGGPGSFETKVWTARPFVNRGMVGAILDYSSPAGEQGFPGKLDIRVIYSLTSHNELRIDYEATTDAPTALNLTNHSYFNLAGAGSGTVRDHLLQIESGRLVESNPAGIPTGHFLDVKGTPFDFRTPAPIGPRLARKHPQLDGRRGLNHSWALANRGRLARAARLEDPRSGRVLEVLTTEPSIHAYTANWFPGTDLGAQGKLYRQHDAIALEAQHFADSPNRPEFPSTMLRPGETYRSTTIYRFSVRKPK
jgi:aldose 1-epimerase